MYLTPLWVQTFMEANKILLTLVFCPSVPYKVGASQKDLVDKPPPPAKALLITAQTLLKMPFSSKLTWKNPRKNFPLLLPKLSKVVPQSQKVTFNIGGIATPPLLHHHLRNPSRD